MENAIRVAIIDDHPPVIEGYLSRLAGHPNIQVVGTGHRGEDLEEILAQQAVDVLILDMMVPVSDSNMSPYPFFHLVSRVLEQYPGLSILVITMYNHPSIIRAVIDSGVSGFILKDDRFFMSNLSSIVETIAHGGGYFSQEARAALFHQPPGEVQLTQRQLQVITLCAAYPQASTSDMARMLKVAHSTLRNLLSSTYLALGVHTRPAAVARAQQLGLIASAFQLPVNLNGLGGSPPE